MDWMLISIVAIAVMNVVSFVMYGLDKYYAIKHRWRIPEAALLLVAFLYGGFGAFAGMQMFRHKTKHIKFQILVPLFLILQICLSLWLLKLI